MINVFFLFLAVVMLTSGHVVAGLIFGFIGLTLKVTFR